MHSKKDAEYFYIFKSTFCLFDCFSVSLDDAEENISLNLLVEEIEKSMTMSESLRFNLKDLKLPTSVKPRGRPKHMGKTNTNWHRGGM